MDSFECLTSWETQYGTTFIYKITDINNNCFIWKTSKNFFDYNILKLIKGTIKEHSTFNHIKQTVLTRCRVS